MPTATTSRDGQAPRLPTVSGVASEVRGSFCRAAVGEAPATQHRATPNRAGSGSTWA
ncbi:hypothetical protein [Streptomyces geranii]|uniref:hypothetical protein n=1 Tax=Streptomyces geranii TaxID=2058923 RepID=UPI0013008EDF|nr:hypothetical protein [Streptomyces geranii]